MCDSKLVGLNLSGFEMGKSWISFSASEFAMEQKNLRFSRLNLTKRGNMIKINERFSIQRDFDCWILSEFAEPGLHPITKEVGTKPRVRERYFPNIHTMVSFLIDLAPAGATTMVELNESIRRIREDVFTAFRGRSA
jgi:hypothetical protein